MKNQLPKKLYRKIISGINSLIASPGRCAVIDEEPYRSLVIRRLIIDNYSVFYYVNGKTETVHILRVIYNRRDWKNLVITQ